MLLSHPQVADAAVFGIPDEDWGEQVKAVIEPAPGRRRGRGAGARDPGLLRRAAREVQVPALARLHGRHAARSERQALQAQAARSLLGGTRAAHLEAEARGPPRLPAPRRDLALLALLPDERARRRAWSARPRAGGSFLSAAQLDDAACALRALHPGPSGRSRSRRPRSRRARVHRSDARHVRALAGPVVRRRPLQPRATAAAGTPSPTSSTLDAIDERVWRTRIEGSRGLPEREWNGPVVGLQEIYATGLARLEQHVAALLRPRLPRARRLAGRQRCCAARTGELREFLDVAFAHCVEGMYGPPEYGGNRGRVGWSYTRWPGDHQPGGYTPEEISPRGSRPAEAASARSAAARARRS